MGEVEKSLRRIKSRESQASIGVARELAQRKRGRGKIESCVPSRQGLGAAAEALER